MSKAKLEMILALYQIVDEDFKQHLEKTYLGKLADELLKKVNEELEKDESCYKPIPLAY